jgi:hypothetical protein
VSGSFDASGCVVYGLTTLTRVVVVQDECTRQRWWLYLGRCHGLIYDMDGCTVDG